MTEQKRENIYKLVGFRGNTLYMLDSVFGHDVNFRGATGTNFELYSQSQIDEANDFKNAKEYYEEIWRMQVEARKTEESLEGFTESALNMQDGDFPGQDTSNLNDVDLEEVNKHWKAYQKQLGNEEPEEIVTLNCTGGGRCFSKNDHYDYIINQDMIDLINTYEK